MILRPMLAVLLVLAGAVGAPAQITAAQASQQLKAAMKGERKAQLAGIKSARQDFLAQLKIFEGVVKAGGYEPGLLQELFVDYQQFLDLVTHYVLTAGNEASLVATPLLAELAAGGPLGGVYPAGFYYGSGGPIDAALDSVFAAQHEAVAAVSRRLGATRRLLEKRAGVALTVVARGTPAQPNAIAFDENGGFWSGQDGAMTLDTAWAASDLSQGGDGMLLLGGTYRDFTGDVAVSISGPANHAFVGTDTPDVFFNRWIAVFDAGLPEGNYAVVAEKPVGGPKVALGIGIR